MRTFKLASGNKLEIHHHDGLGLLTMAWHRKPPSDADIADYWRNCHKWVRAALPANYDFKIYRSNSNPLGVVEFKRRARRKA